MSAGLLSILLVFAVPLVSVVKAYSRLVYERQTLESVVAARQGAASAAARWSDGHAIEKLVASAFSFRPATLLRSTRHVAEREPVAVTL